MRADGPAKVHCIMGNVALAINHIMSKGGIFAYNFFILDGNSLAHITFRLFLQLFVNINFLRAELKNLTVRWFPLFSLLSAAYLQQAYHVKLNRV